MVGGGMQSRITGNTVKFQEAAQKVRSKDHGGDPLRASLLLNATAFWGQREQVHLTTTTLFGDQVPVMIHMHAEACGVPKRKHAGCLPRLRRNVVYLPSK